MKRALITGITGQDGSYLSELLISLGYEVHGFVREMPKGEHDLKYWRIRSILPKLKLHAGSLLNPEDVRNCVRQARPDECYHLAARTFVSYSFEDEAQILDTNLKGTHSLLSALKSLSHESRVFFAGSSEMFGRAEKAPQNEKTPFHPRSVYGVSKVAGFELVRNYRENHKMHASTGILYNHESPRRGEEFVTRKITVQIAKIKAGKESELKLGATDAQRDWGYAPEYAEAMHRMLQQAEPDDYVIATGKTHSVQAFIDLAFSIAGLDPQKYLKTDPSLLRPAESYLLAGDAAKAKKVLGWSAKAEFKDWVREMVESDLQRFQ